MVNIRRSGDRGGGSFGWLRSRHSFSFGSYYDPAHMGFRSLRVINEDWIEPDSGFPTHPHRDMEILTYVLEGALEHGDSLGNGSTIRPGEIQKMSAGTGITHSEFNPSDAEPTHLLQIWIEPAARGVAPSYAQVPVPVADQPGRLHLVAGADPGAPVGLQQDASVHAARLRPGDEISYDLAPGRGLWVQTARGRLRAGDQPLEAGDGLSIENERRAVLRATDQEAEILLFDLA